MKADWKRPDPQRASLDACCRGGALDPVVDLFSYIGDKCQAAIERIRRMTSVWVAENQTADSYEAISMAAARFAARSSGRKENSWQGPLRFAIVGALAAAALLLVMRRMGLPASSSVATSSPSAAEEVDPARSVFQPSRASEPSRGPDRLPRAALA